jgi:gluconolactonase
VILQQNLKAMETTMTFAETPVSHATSTRRRFLKAAAQTGLAAASGAALAQSFDFKPNQRYPDPAVLILDPSFAKYRIYSSSVEQLGTGMRWAEGPVYFPSASPGQPGHLLLSDIPNNRLMKFDEATQKFSVHKQNVNYANGNTRDRQGRLVTCEHSVTRRIVRTEKDGKLTVLADRFEGKRLNAPNDIAVKSDDSIWFTDPLFGINGEWEGARAQPEQATTNVYRIDKGGKLSAVITELVNPNGLAFSPDESKLYVVEWKGTPNRSIWSYDIAADGSASNKTKVVDADGPGALDGFRVDRDGNLWCGWGFNGSYQAEATDVGGGMKAHLPNARSEDFDGVKVFNPAGKAIGFIRLPERCANLEFGGPKRNRLYMASCHSLYAIYVEAHGAV